MDDLFYKLLILRTPGIGPVKYAELIRSFGNARDAAASLMCNDSLCDSVKREMNRAASMGIIYLADDDLNYPATLREIKNHPPVLTVRGNLSVFAKSSVGIVGTRHATGAGMRFISELSHSFAENGYAVVSGMAMGTDTAAHTGALCANGDSQTIAVLAGGVDYVWPLENESLYHEIIARGAVVSELPVGTIPVTNNFIQRNRWVSALSQKLILGEADQKSGSMATARFATEHKRPVFAVPGHPLDARSVGPNQLIRAGVATLCMGASDFFDVNKTKKSNPENDVINKLGIVPLSESVLAELVKKNIMEIKQDLMVLELQGLVRKQEGGYIKI